MTNTHNEAQTPSPLTPEEWSHLVQQLRQKEDELTKLANNTRIPWEKRRPREIELADILEALIEEYLDRLPRLPLSRCPYCGELLIRQFDPFGLEGLWWQAEFPIGEEKYYRSKTCKHFVLLLGALNLNGLPPKGGKEDARPGPEVPYVIARLLDAHPTRVAVISAFAMFNGYTAYPIAYFSEEEPLIIDALNASWGRETYDVLGGWTDKVDDEFDYDLLPWVEQGKIQWIEPGDPTYTLSHSEHFPYANLPGRRKSMVIWDNKVL